MSQFLHNNDDAKAITIPRVFSKNSRATNLRIELTSSNTLQDIFNEQKFEKFSSSCFLSTLSLSLVLKWSVIQDD